MNILFLADKIDYVSGVAKHLFYLTDELIKNKQDKIYVICAESDMKEEFIKSGAHLIEFPRMLFEKRSGINFILSLLFIIQFCRKNNISIIHSHTHYTANLGYFAAKILMIKSVQTIHGLFPEEGRLPHYKADFYIAVNERIITHMVQIGVNSRKIFLTRQGVPVNSGPVKKIPPLKILCASRLVYDKGIDIFINSICKISDEINTEVEFVIAGEGEYESDLKKLAGEKGVKINFAGKLKNLNHALAESHIFVFPSRIKTEGFPVVLIEAGMNDALIITSNFDSLVEGVEPTKDCIIFYNDDYEDLARKLLFAINNYNNLTTIVENWRKKCINDFTSEIMAKKIKEVYLKLKIKN